jgi:hypothetical protein
MYDGASNCAAGPSEGHATGQQAIKSIPRGKRVVHRDALVLRAGHHIYVQAPALDLKVDRATRIGHCVNHEPGNTQ